MQSSRNVLPVAEVDTVEVTAAARSVVDTEAAVVDAIVNMDRTAVARATAVAVSPDTAAVASLDSVAAVVVALTAVAMAHKLLEATQVTEVRSHLMQQLRQSQPQLNLPLLQP
jgi:hypothetical protein